MTTRKRTALFATGALVLLTTTTHADAGEKFFKVFVNPGIVASWSFKPDTASGPGFEISAGYFDFDNKLYPHGGGFFRTQGYNTGPWGWFHQNTIGLEGGLLLGGIELGVAFRDDFTLAKATTGFHVMPYFTLGVVYVGPQFMIPFDGAPVEIAFNLGFKFPIIQTIGVFALAASNFGRMPSGRPLRAKRGRQECTAPLRKGKGWSRRGARSSPRVRGLDPHERARLAAHWSDEARAEHASVATFAKLVLELMAVGAPASLVRRAQRAAADEIRHAEIAFRFASVYAGTSIEPGPIDVPGVRKPSLVRLAVESFLDGQIGEGLAAATLRARATESDDPVVRKALRTIARDEARHAALGRAIVRWCERKNCAPVRRALAGLFHGSALGSGRFAGAG